MRQEWPLVGREGELHRLGALLRDGRPAGAVITGAAGSGKTRLAAEALGLARDRDLPTATVTASVAASAIPLGAVASLLPPLDEPPGATTHGTLYRAGRALAALGDGAPLVLGVDDAHLLDAVSAALLLQTTLDGAVIPVVTVRAGEPVPDPIVALWKDGHTERIDLEPLARSDTTALVAAGLGGELDAATGQRLWETSRGNPLYVRELVLGALESGALAAAGGVWALRGALSATRSLAELVGQRLDGLPTGARRTLDLLALADVLGLAALAALGADGGLAALERRGLVEVVADGRRRAVRLAHPLYGEVLRGAMPRTRALELASALAGLAGTLPHRRREDVLRLATWQLEAGIPSDGRLLASAARQAYHAGDYPLAERLACAALDHGTSVDAALLLGQIMHEHGRHDEAERLLSDLAGSSELAAAPDGERARAALQRAVNLFFGLGREADAQTVLADTRRRVTEAGAVAVLVTNQAWLHLAAGRPGEALLLVRALDGAEEPDVRLMATVTSAWAAAVTGRPREALEAADEAAALRDAGDRPTLNRFRDFPDLPRALALLEVGRLTPARELVESGLEASLRGQPAFIQAWWLFLHGRLALLEGRPRTAARWFRQGAALQRRLHQPGLLRWQLAGEALATAVAGDAGAAEALLAEHDALAARPERLFSALADLARAWSAAARGERSTALRFLREAAGRARASGLEAFEAEVLHDLARLGDPGAAGRLSALADRADAGLAQARSAHVAALVAGDVDALERAAETFAEAGALLLAAEAYADAVLVDRPGSRRAHARRLRASTLAASCEGAVTPTLRRLDEPEPLTEREREVTMLAASGLASKAIAARLFISPRTVDNLLQRAYRKLGVRSRAEAREALSRKRAHHSP